MSNFNPLTGNPLPKPEGAFPAMPGPGGAAGLGGPMSVDPRKFSGQAYYRNMYGTNVDVNAGLSGVQGNAQFPLGDHRNGNTIGISAGYGPNTGWNVGFSLRKLTSPPPPSPVKYEMGINVGGSPQMGGMTPGVPNSNPFGQFPGQFPGQMIPESSSPKMVPHENPGMRPPGMYPNPGSPFGAPPIQEQPTEMSPFGVPVVYR